MDRRKFLKKSLAATAVAAVSPLMASPLARLMEDNNSKTNTVMTKKMILLNASPRKNRNTAQMLESVIFPIMSYSIDEQTGQLKRYLYKQMPTALIYTMNCTPKYYEMFKFRMLSRYRKIKVDSRLSAAEDRGRYSVCSVSAVKLLSSISFYLLLSPSIYKASGACES